MNANKIITVGLIIGLVIPITGTHAQNVAINTTGNQADPKHALEVISSNTNSGTKAIYAENVTPAALGGWSYGIFGTVPSGYGYTVGVRGTSFTKDPELSGRSYGGYFTAGNAGGSSGGWNYGMYARLLGSNHGAAVVGFNDKDYDWNGNTNGSWAGYFVGDVNITEDLIVEGTVQANTGWHGSSNTIKILPSDFMPNDNSPYYNASIEDDAPQKGVKNASSVIDLVAFVAIPEGYSTQGVTIYANGNLSTIVYEVDMTSGTWTIIGNGLTNTTTIANVSSTSTNYLAIKLLSSGGVNVIYGGTVTITN